MVEKRDDFRLLFAKQLFTPNKIQREVLCRLRQPGGRVLWNARVRPSPQCPDQGFLDDVLRKLQSVDPKDSGQNRNELCRLVPKKMIRQARNLAWRCCFILL